MWIYERYDWMHFDWDKNKISALVEKVSAAIGFLHGRIASLADDVRRFRRDSHSGHRVLFPH